MHVYLPAGSEKDSTAVRQIVSDGIVFSGGSGIRDAVREVCYGAVRCLQQESDSAFCVFFACCVLCRIVLYGCFVAVNREDGAFKAGTDVVGSDFERNAPVAAVQTQGDVGAAAVQL